MGPLRRRRILPIFVGLLAARGVSTWPIGVVLARIWPSSPCTRIVLRRMPLRYIFGVCTRLLSTGVLSAWSSRLPMLAVAGRSQLGFETCLGRSHLPSLARSVLRSRHIVDHCSPSVSSSKESLEMLETHGMLTGKPSLTSPRGVPIYSDNLLATSPDILIYQNSRPADVAIARKCLP